MSSGLDLTLLSAAGSTGAWMPWAGGRGLFSVYGTFDGATVELEWAPDTSNNTDLGAEASVTAAASRVFELAPGYIRAAVANAGSTSVTATATTF